MKNVILFFIFFTHIFGLCFSMDQQNDAIKIGSCVPQHILQNVSRDENNVFEIGEIVEHHGIYIKIVRGFKADKENVGKFESFFCEDGWWPLTYYKASEMGKIQK